MRFGTYFFLQATPDRTPAEVITGELDQMVLSEQLGFDSVWLTEHHFSDYGLSAAPSVLAAAPAARTRRVSIGSSGLGTPLPALERLRSVYASALQAAELPSRLVDELLATWVVTKHAYVADTDAQARREAEPHERWYLDSFARSLRPDGLVGI